ncbi:hypothetical protein JDY09_04380 [Thermoleophilum album]|jgi:hypothetical protein|uniref:hypothetical protein n=1 Tax=Thermoleophilum album TaxID=29539 RepID=UPI000CBD1517|nr:hypothetical protein [Thermoleophilum album]MCL6439950.1 hypothetical protein [Thermoleophilum sp.]WDT94493.1 hypothetical protein JDY09_04380 [Thermoleophilum album]GBD45554.1 hypothetical protein HRbin41_00362 [bacterium HR41]
MGGSAGRALVRRGALVALVVVGGWVAFKVAVGLVATLLWLALGALVVAALAYLLLVWR